MQIHAYVVEADYFGPYARCDECGWTGPVRADGDYAQDDADEHDAAEHAPLEGRDA